MKAVPSWLSYSVYRILMFAVPLAVLLMLSIVSAIVAALIGLCLSYIFLRKPREKVALDLYTARHPSAEIVHPDAESEDAAIDRAADAAAASAEAADAAGRATTTPTASAAPAPTVASAPAAQAATTAPAATAVSEREGSAQ